MTKGVRYRVRVESDMWYMDRGVFRPTQKSYSWKIASQHHTLDQLLEYAIEHVMREGYNPRGLKAFQQEHTRAIEKIRGWIEKLTQSMKAELEL